jgi:hypothetical protein
MRTDLTASDLRSAACRSEEVAKARDGRTFGLTTDAISVNPAILPDMPYDTIREIQGVMEIGTAPLLLAAATGRRPWRDAAEMLDAARRRQGNVSAGTSGSGLSNLFVVLASAQTGAGQPKSGGPERIGLRRAIFGLLRVRPVNRSAPKTPGNLPLSAAVGQAESTAHTGTGGGSASGYERSLAGFC